MAMQRLFSSFANGWPGKGLLIQRAFVAAVLADRLYSSLGPAANTSGVLTEFEATGAGVRLLIGLWTPIAGTVLAVVELGMIFSRAGDPWLTGMLALLGAALAMIGPGAWSIDAVLFGRKRIELS